MVVIDNEDSPVGDGGNLVNQGGQDSLGWWRLRGPKRTQRSVPDVVGRFLPGLDRL